MSAKLLVLFCMLCILHLVSESNAIGNDIITVDDLKGWKKVMKSRTNVLTLFTSGPKSSPEALLPMLEEVAKEMKGRGAVVTVDCSSSTTKKVCKSLKVSPKTYLLKHYKDGSFHKDYDRLLRKSSFIKFLSDPTGDAPWSEDPTSKDIRHVDTSTSFYKLLDKEQKKPILAMFYVPWCGHCQRLKPEFAKAATKLKGKALLVGMNLETPEANLLQEEYNVTGYPTILYFEEGKLLYNYWGGRNEESIINWMSNPQPPPTQDEDTASSDETNWSTDLSNIVHLTASNFDTFVTTNPSVLVTFYAPWCGHCKAMKPDYNEAAKLLQEENIPGILAAVDATQEKDLATMFQVNGFPTIKYFQNGEPVYDYGYSRTTEGFVSFMKDPQPPPEPEKDWTELDTQVTHLTDETFKPFTKKTKHALIMFYAPWCGHCKAAKPHFIEAADLIKTERKMSLGAVDCTKYDALCSQYDVKGYPTILYSSYGKKSFKYVGPRTSDSFVEFLNNPDKYAPTVKDEF